MTKLFEKQTQKKIALAVIAFGIKQTRQNIRQLVFIRLDQVKHVEERVGKRSSCGVLTDLDLNPGAGCFGGEFKQAGGNFSIDIFFAAVCADAGRNAFEDQSSSVFV